MIKILLIIVSILWVGCIYAQDITYEKASDGGVTSTTDMIIITVITPKVERVSLCDLKSELTELLDSQAKAAAAFNKPIAEVRLMIAEAEKLGLKEFTETPIEEIKPE